MRDRVDRRYALLLGVVLALWALVLDLAVVPVDLGSSASGRPAAVVGHVVTPAAAPDGRDGPGSRG